jgi:Zn-dependent M28 family amino/carboxypeptidase
VRYSGGNTVVFKRNKAQLHATAPVLAKFQSKNIYAVLKANAPSSNDKDTPALLLTAHLDSVVTAPGAFDDGIGVVIVLELLRAILAAEQTISEHQKSRPFDLVVLFGNGEELGLYDAEAFAQSPFWPATKAFINLEAGGIGRRAMLFRSAGDTLRQLFARVAPRPHMNVLATDVFRLGLIPSDTNFRTWAIEGGRDGLDLAFYENRFYYHTPQDAVDKVTGREVQQFGDNLLALLNAFVEEDYFNRRPEQRHNSEEDETLVYFDLHGMMLLSWSKQVHISLLFVVVATIVLLLLWNRDMKGCILSLFACNIKGGVLGCLSTVCLAFMFHQVNPSIVGAQPLMVLGTVMCWTLTGMHLMK